jgi:phospholipid/cholesterol/gamma-HCH transport system substrate-binding protein
MRALLNTMAGKLFVLGVFFAIGATVFVYLYLGIGGYVPFVTSRQYVLEVDTSNASNLVPASHVSIAGVQVGQLQTVEREGGHARIIFTIDSQYAPLHQGVHVRLGQRSLVAESYFDVTDGHGPELPSGSVVPAQDFQPDVPLHDVLASFDPKTRAEMSSLFRSLSAGTAGTEQDVSVLMSGLGDLGRQGNTALDAIAAQSADLRSLGHDTSTLINTLDTSEGQIADMVTSADRLTKATSGESQAVAATMNTMPGVLDSATHASADLTELSGALHPVVSDLRAASPFLSDALNDLPDTTHDLRDLLPGLSGTFHRGPDTFRRIPDFRDDAHDTFHTGRQFLRDLNPMLHYLRPYGPEIGAFFANFNAITQYTDGVGDNYIRLEPVFNDQSVGGVPFAYNGPLTYVNPFPAPGSQPNPGPWHGTYPHVKRLPG